MDGSFCFSIFHDGHGVVLVSATGKIRVKNDYCENGSEIIVFSSI